MGNTPIATGVLHWVFPIKLPRQPIAPFAHLLTVLALSNPQLGSIMSAALS